MVTPLRSKYASKLKRAWYFPDTGEKICAKCGTKASVSNFFRHSATQDGWHSWCKECCKIGNQKSKEKKYLSFEGRINTILQSCKRSAKKRGHIVNLTRDDLLEMWNYQEGVCAYTGIVMLTQANSPYSVSVERIDNSVGYTKENTILVCNIVNKMKSNFDGVLFYKICRAVVDMLGDEEGNLGVDFIK